MLLVINIDVGLKIKNYIPFVNWKVYRAHLSAANLTVADPSFMHSASTGPNNETCIMMAAGLTYIQFKYR